MNKWIWLLIITLFNSSLAFSQGDLNQKINIDVSDETFENILLEIADQASLSISYNAAILPVDSIFSLKVENSTVNQVLQVLLGKELELKLSGNHLVVLNSRFYKGSSNKTKQSYKIDGFVKDTEGQSISNATVFSVSNLESTQTDQSGYFSLEVSLKDEFMGLSIIQPDFEDETIVLEAKSQNVSISLQPISGVGASIKTAMPNNGFDNMKIVKSLSNPTALQMRGNLNTYLSIPAQISFLPFVGTNLLMSGLVENRFSFNVLSGFNGAVNGVEIGGILNMTRHYMQGVQVGGVWNIVGKEVKGVQLAGILNTNLRSVTGISIAGISNFTFGELKGIQLASILNVNIGKIRGSQISAIANYAHDEIVKGGQVSSILNVAIQGADFQVSAVGNYSKNTDIAQIGSVLNVAKDSLKGLQLGLLNFAGRNRGLQIGIFNISKADKGSSFGILNIVLGGYNKLEGSLGLLQQRELKLKLGTERFYNILGHNFLPNNKINVVYGFGFLTGRNEKSKWSFDFTHTSFVENNYLSNSKFLIGKSYRFTKWLELYGGISLNYQLNRNGVNLSFPYNENMLLPIYSITGPTFNSDFWVGVEAGIRVF